MTFRNKTIRGQTYSLDHLAPFEMEVTPTAKDAPTFRVGVSFNSHVFTRKFEAEDSPDLAYADGAETRAFCIERHKCSLLLPQIIREARRAHFSEDRNYLLVEDIAGIEGPYAVFFDVRRAKSSPVDVRMFVVSAYAKPDLPKRLDRITFATLVSKIARGEQIKRPKK